MTSGGWTIVIIAAIICGLIASAIAQGRTKDLKSFLSFFILGTILPLIGNFLALQTGSAGQRPQAEAKAPALGWYTDPRGVAKMRWWDGIDWTEATS